MRFITPLLIAVALQTLPNNGPQVTNPASGEATGPVTFPNEMAVPTAPSDGRTKMFTLGVGDAGFGFPFLIDDTSTMFSMSQPFPNARCWFDGPPGGSGLNLGLDVTGIGTGSNGALTSTDLITSKYRVSHASAAGANSSAGLRGSSLTHMTRGNAAGVGGFMWATRWAVVSSINTQRLFIGLQNLAGAPGTVDPSTLTGTVYIGADSADTNMSICSNDNSGNATCTTLGDSFPKGGAGSGTLYDTFLYAPTFSNTVGYLIRNLSTGALASGTVTSDLPVATDFFAWYVWVNNGATGGVATNITFSTCSWVP